MSWLETVRTGLDGVRTRRLRSMLTVVGIMIGIAAVVLTVGLGEGAQNKVSSEINALGANLLTVSPGSSTSSSGIQGGLGTAKTLTDTDADALGSTTVAPDVKSVAPVAEQFATMTAGSRNWTADVVGSTPSWLEVRDRNVSEGRFIDRQDVADHTAVAVLGTTVAAELFKGLDPVGQTIDIDGVPTTVVGVLNAVGSSGTSSATSQDDQVVVPLTMATERLFGTTSLNSILVAARSQARLSAAYQEVDTELLALHQITKPVDANFTITSQKSLVSAATSVDRTLTVLLAGIAAISLLVGGIGVMNIMIVSVTERTREIGLRKALGATPPLIRRQFLFEASVLGLSGGALGALVGALGAILLPHAVGEPIALSGMAMGGALLVAIAIGLLFGVYPASRAARMAPIDALRTE
ncbi:MAG: ABC transporter permease [Acidimicrobiales bacterium]